MAVFDNHANFGVSTVAVAPSPAASGLTLDVADASTFPAVPFNCTVSPPNVRPTLANSEIVRVTDITGSTFTIDRAQEGTSAKNIAVGWVIANSITVKVITDLETAVNAPINVSAGATSYQTSALTFNNGNGVSFGITNGVITASVVPPSGAVVSFSAGTTDVAAAQLSFEDTPGVQFALTGSTILATHNGLTSQSNQVALAANGNFAFQTLSFSNAQGVSFATSAGSAIVASIATSLTNIKVSAGDTSYHLSALTFDNANNVSFGITDSVLTASASFPAQTNQTLGLYASSNTILTSSGTVDARSMSVRAAGSLSVGYSNGELVLSAANALTSQSNQAFSAAGGASAFQTLSFNNSFGVSFSNSDGAVVASIATTYAGTGFTSAGNNIGISGTLDTAGLSLSATVAAQTNQTVGWYGSSNTTLTSSGTADARSLSVRAIGSLTVGFSNGELLLSAANALTSQSNQAFSAGGGASNFQTLSFANSFGVSFSNSNGSVVGSIATTYAGTGFTSAGNNIGLSGTLNTSGLSLSATVAAQTNQTIGLYASSNTTLTSSGTLDARSFSVRAIGSLTAGFSNGELLLSAANALTSQTNQTVGWYGSSNTTLTSSGTADARSLSVRGIGGASVGFSNGELLISGATGLTSQSTQFLAMTLGGNTAGTTTFHATNNASLFFHGGNNITLSGNGSSVTISGPNTSAQQTGISGIGASNSTYTSGTVIFSNQANITIGTSVDGASQYVRFSVGAQSNQTLGLYMSSNTTSSVSSGTVDARSMTFRGMGIASVGYSGGEVIVSVPAGGGGLSAINISACTTSNNLSAFTLSNANGVTFGLDASTITASVSTYSTVGTATTGYPVASANSVGTITRWAAEDHRHAGIGGFGISSEGNTAGTTGSQQGTYWLRGTGAVTISQITSNNGSHTGVISVAPPVTGSYFANLPSLAGMLTGASAISQMSGSSMFIQPFQLPYHMSVGWLRLLASFNDSAVGTGGTPVVNSTFSVDRYTTIGYVVYSQGVGASSRSIQSLTSSSDAWTGRTIVGAGAQSSRYTITIQKSYPVSGTTSSYTSSYAVSSASIVISSDSNTLFTGPRYMDLRFGVSLSPGNYWLGVGLSTGSATNSANISFATTAGMGLSYIAVSNTNLSFGVVGAATAASDHQLYRGLGVWTTNALTLSRDSIGVNSISQAASNPQLPFQLMREA